MAGDRLVGSAAVAGGRVIFGCDDALVYALDAATGKLLWRYAMDGPVEATPLVDAAGVVYAASNKTEMAAIAAANGAQIWNTSTRFGYLASPALGNGLILAADTGGIVWEKHAPGAQEFASSPLVLAGQVLAANTSGTVTVWDNASGKLLRQIAVGSWLTGSPTWTGDAVLLAGSAGELLAMQSAPSVRSQTLNPVWQHTFYGGNNPNIFAASLLAQPILTSTSPARGASRSRFSTVKGTCGS